MHIHCKREHIFEHNSDRNSIAISQSNTPNLKDLAPELKNFFHAQLQMLKKIFLVFKLSAVVFIVLINVKMPTYNIYEHDKLHAQLS